MSESIQKYMNMVRVTSPYGTKMQCNPIHIVCYKSSLDKGCNTKPLQEEVDHHLHGPG